ncbi:MerR family transcriptional regulator [Streptomyces sp. NPDC086010]|uniref:MerR family transcriptional regulator n=1 Tax=Streptomyces sp. NPDC086010 TaxID=3365745 RepID=UPI0037D117EF
MKIGDLAARTGVSTRLLRYYEEVGILHPFRSSNGYRTYGEPAVDRVLQIRELLQAGLTAEMIREVLLCLDAENEGKGAQGTASCPITKDLEGLRRQLSSIERRIDILQRNRQAIVAYLGACEDGASATPVTVEGALSRLRRDGGDTPGGRQAGSMSP